MRTIGSPFLLCLAITCRTTPAQIMPNSNAIIPNNNAVAGMDDLVMGDVRAMKLSTVAQPRSRVRQKLAAQQQQEQEEQQTQTKASGDELNDVPLNNEDEGRTRLLVHRQRRQLLAPLYTDENEESDIERRLAKEDEPRTKKSSSKEKRVNEIEASSARNPQQKEIQQKKERKESKLQQKATERQKPNRQNETKTFAYGSSNDRDDMDNLTSKLQKKTAQTDGYNNSKFNEKGQKAMVRKQYREKKKEQTKDQKDENMDTTKNGNPRKEKKGQKMKQRERPDQKKKKSGEERKEKDTRKKTKPTPHKVASNEGVSWHGNWSVDDSWGGGSRCICVEWAGDGWDNGGWTSHGVRGGWQASEGTASGGRKKKRKKPLGRRELVNIGNRKDDDQGDYHSSSNKSKASKNSKKSRKSKPSWSEPSPVIRPKPPSIPPETTDCKRWKCETRKPTTSPPNFSPTLFPTITPTLSPTLFPTLNPTLYPTLFPTITPSFLPTLAPTLQLDTPIPTRCDIQDNDTSEEISDFDCTECRNGCPSGLACEPSPSAGSDRWWCVSGYWCGIQDNGRFDCSDCRSGCPSDSSCVTSTTPGSDRWWCV